MKLPFSRISPLLALTLGLSALAEPAPPAKETILGHGAAKYRVHLDWAKADPAVAPVINSHAMAEGSDGLLYLVTDHPENAFLVFKKDGTFVRHFGKGLEGGHGLEIFKKDGVEYLIHVDCGWHFGAEGWTPRFGRGAVTLLKMDGTIVRRFADPVELGLMKPEEKFNPTDVAVTPEGTILVVDGYASDRIFEFTFTGELVRHWGGHKKDDPGNLSNAHGISIDLSDAAKPLVWVSSREENLIKAFTLDGKFVEKIDLPGAYAGQLFIRGDKMYSAVCWSKENGTGKRLGESGFVVVIDRKTRKVISAPGGSEPVYVDGKLQPLRQTDHVFLHGHDLYVDSEENIYVGEWNAKRRYPTKLELVK